MAEEKKVGDIPEKMNAVLVKKYCAPVAFQQVPTPKCGEIDILIAIRAASLNPLDWKEVDGMLEPVLPYPLPFILGHDVSGVVVQVGAKVDRFKVGDEVYSRVPSLRIGTCAEYIAVKQDAVALKPKNISFEEAASLPLVGLTAVQSFDRACLQQGHKVFVPAGAGGVGSFAIQYAKNVVGAAHVTTTASAAKVAICQQLGADEVVNYKEESTEQMVRKPERAKQFDVVFDTTGESIPLMEMLKPNGYCVSIATTPDGKGMNEKNRDFQISGCKRSVIGFILDMKAAKFTKAAAAHGVRYGYVFMDPDGAKLSEITKWVEEGKIKPLLDKTFPLDKTADALAYLKTGRATGKVVIKVA